jgi:hypothetical protein
MGIVTEVGEAVEGDKSSFKRSVVKSKSWLRAWSDTRACSMDLAGEQAEVGVGIA